MTKQQQINHNRLRPKPSQKNKDRKSNGLNICIPSERIKPKAFKCKEYLTWLHETKKPKCFVCGGSNGIELHHVKEASGDLRNDNEVIPLCGIEHHRLGTTMSVHSTPVLFRETFPIKLQKIYALKLWIEYKQTL